MTTDDRIELALTSQFGEIATKAVEGRRLALAPLPDERFRCCRTSRFRSAALAAAFATFHAVAEQVENLFSDVFELHAEVHQDLGRHPFLFT